MKSNLVSKLENMSKEDLYEAIYTDPLTSVLNRRALEEQPYTKIAFIDLDSLKWINDNLSHEKGNEILRELATKLKNVFGKENVYRLGGDEFAVICNYEGCELPLAMRIDSLRSVYPKFSYGVGSTLKEADLALNEDKTVREEVGLRASRGNIPPWI